MFSRMPFGLLAAVTLVSCAAKAPAEGPTPPLPKHSATGRSIQSLEVKTILAIVRSSFPSFTKCYAAGLERDPKLEGRLATRFVIQSDGMVKEAKEDSSSSFPNPAVAACIVERFKELRFPTFDHGIVTVVFPIRLSPGD